MRTISEFLKNEFTKTLVKIELKKGLSVFLIQNLRTKETALTSQPYYFNGKREMHAMGLLAGNDSGIGGDTFSKPIDQIDSIEQLECIIEAPQNISYTNTENWNELIFKPEFLKKKQFKT